MKLFLFCCFSKERVFQENGEVIRKNVRFVKLTGACLRMVVLARSEAGEPLLRWGKVVPSFELSSKKKRIRGHECDEGFFETAVGFDVGLVHRHERGGVVEGFVAAHEVAENVTDEDLSHTFAFGEFVHQFDRALDRAIERRIAG